MTATPDPDHPNAWWFSCRNCGRGGDQLTLAPGGLVASVGPRLAALARCGLPVPAAAPETAKAYETYAERRRLAQLRCAGRYGRALRADLRAALDLPWPPPDERLYFGCEVNWLFWAFDVVEFRLNRPRAPACVPVSDLPDRVMGVAYLDKPGTAWHFASWKRTVEPAYGGVALAAAAAADGPKSWGGRAVLATDLGDALALHAAHAVAVPAATAPVLALHGHPREAGRAAGRIVASGVVWSRPGDLSGLWACHLAGCDLVFADRPAAAATAHPSWAAEHLLAAARPWPEALAAELGRLDAPAAADALARAAWGPELARAAGRTAAAVHDVLRASAAAPAVVTAGDFQVRETAAGWACLATGRLLSDTALVVESVTADPNDDYGCLYRGEIRQGARSAAFVVPAGRLRADPVGAVEAVCVRAGLGVPAVDPDFAKHFLGVALALRPPDAPTGEPS